MGENICIIEPQANKPQQETLIWMLRHIPTFPGQRKGDCEFKTDLS